MHFPLCFKFPPYFREIFRLWRKFSQFCLFPKNFLIFIRRNFWWPFFNYRPQISNFPLFYTNSPAFYVLYVYFVSPLLSPWCICASPNARREPSIKYVTLFLANFYSPPLSHFVTHPGTFQKSTSHISDPRFLVGLVQNTRTKPPCTNYLLIVREGFYLGGFVRGSFVWKVLSGMVFVRSIPFCHNSSVTTES